MTLPEGEILTDPSEVRIMAGFLALKYR